MHHQGRACAKSTTWGLGGQGSISLIYMFIWLAGSVQVRVSIFFRKSHIYYLVIYVAVS